MERTYTYEALISPQHIRVLTLAPSEDTRAILQCSLDQQEIDDASNEYEAISYTWGDQERTDPLMCDETTINITPNLASALLRFRSRTDPRRLWADAICINQDDLDEKGQQISLMASIFRSASLVRVWLGNGDEGESQALADIASLVKRISPTAVQYQDTESETFQALKKLRSPLKEIFSMPWFGRRWIVQELVLNGNVMFHCGMSTIPWSSLHFAFHSLSKSPWADDLDARSRRKIRQFENLWRTWCFADVSTMNCGIYSLLHSFQDLECKEPKDTIYAIASLANDIHLKLQSPIVSFGVGPAIIPRYDPMVSLNEVIQDLAFKTIASGQVFDTLSHAGASRTMQTESLLPSWVPDVRRPVLWLLIAREDKADFELVNAREPSYGSLTIRIHVYGWQDKFAFRPRDLDDQLTSSGLVLPRDPSSGHHSWRLLSVGDVLKTPEDRTLRRGYDLEKCIIDWLSHRYLPFVYKNRTKDMDPRHMVWSILRSQLLTEVGPESLERLGSLEEWQQLRRHQHQNYQRRWSPYLIKAVSKRTIFHGNPQLMQNADKINGCNYFDFGPRSLSPRDAIFIPSPGSQATTALFLRHEATGLKVLGGGLVWVESSDNPFIGLKQRQIEVRSI